MSGLPWCDQCHAWHPPGECPAVPESLRETYSWAKEQAKDLPLYSWPMNILLELLRREKRLREQIEQRCDPAGDTRTIGELRDTIRGLEAALAQLQGKYNVDMEFWKAHANAKDAALAQARKEIKRLSSEGSWWRASVESHRARIDAALALSHHSVDTRCKSCMDLSAVIVRMVKALTGGK